MVRLRQPDALDEFIAERTAKSPAFAANVEAALRRREILRRMATARERRGLTQREVAQRMRTSQPAIAKIEAGDVDIRSSTLERYAAAVGGRIEYRFVRSPNTRSRTAAVGGRA